MKYEIAVFFASLLILPLGVFYWWAGKKIDEHNDSSKSRRGKEKEIQ